VEEEKNIITGLQAGKEAAFRELVETYQRMVINTCYGMVHHREDAEDLAQEVFIEVYRSVSSFRHDSKLSTWLYRIAVNKSLNYLRSRKRKRDRFPGESITGNQSRFSRFVDENTPRPGAELEEEQRAALLHKAIDALPDKQKTAFTLNKYEELPYREISDIMEISLSSVESLIHRAKKNLQKKLYVCYKKRCL
jgi:RNA polymerase sigma-70 factor, ECF subfamily